MKKYQGQEAIEFILISSLILIGCIASLLIFNGTIKNFFNSDSAISKTSDIKISAINGSTGIAYDQDFKTSYGALDDPELSKYNVVKNSDGSISFQVGSQKVNLPARVVQLQDTVMQTTGSSGAAELIKDIAKMIETYSGEFGGNVPIELNYGTGQRSLSSNSNLANYHATEESNSYSVKAGNHVLIVQNDQSCDGSECNYLGKYKISGSLDANNVLQNANVEILTKNTDYCGIFNGYVDTTNGLKIYKGDFNITDVPNSEHDWKVSFTDPGKTFNI